MSDEGMFCRVATGAIVLRNHFLDLDVAKFLHYLFASHVFVLPISPRNADKNLVIPNLVYGFNRKPDFLECCLYLLYLIHCYARLPVSQ